MDTLIIVGARTLHHSCLYLDTDDPQIHFTLPAEAPHDGTVTVQMASEYLFLPVGLLTLARSLNDVP